MNTPSTPSASRRASSRFLSIVAACAVASVALAQAACSSDDPPNTQPLADGGGGGGDTGVAPADAGEAGPGLPPEQLVGRLDRAGRAAVSFAIVAPTSVPDASVTTESYNHDNLYAFSARGRQLVPETYAPLFQRRLVQLDNADGKMDWDGGPAEGLQGQVPVNPDAPDGSTKLGKLYPHPLTKILTADQLVVDMSKPFGPSGYLEIEKTVAIDGSPGTHTTCGGRWLADDAVDKQLSLMVSRSLTGVSDGVGEATKPPTETFPYLATPN